MKRFILLTATVLFLSALTVIAQAQVDLDIAAFRATKRASVSKAKPVTIKLVVQNAGTVDEARPATITGIQNGFLIYLNVTNVSDPVGNGRSTFAFTAPSPANLGDITWSVVINDDSVDVDLATTVTTVVP